MTTEHRCPNCRSVAPADGTPCSACGWMPLQPTEMLFVDDQTMPCPSCSRRRPVADPSCPYCGSRDVLASLSRQSVNYHISTLLSMTTLVAVCFALVRVSLELGTLAFLLVGLASLRTALLIRLRKRHRYPVHSRDVLRLFGRSAGGIVLGAFTFAGASMVMGFMFGPLLSGLAVPSPSVGVAMFVMFVLGSQAGALVLVGREPANRGFILLGAATAFLPGLIALATGGSSSFRYAGLFVMVGLCVCALGTVLLACRQGGLEQAKSFLIGFSVGMCLLGPVAPLLHGARVGWEMAAGLGCMTFLVWPALLTILALAGMWSWDDAFPTVAPRIGPMSPIAGPQRSGGAGDGAR